MRSHENVGDNKRGDERNEEKTVESDLGRKGTRVGCFGRSLENMIVAQMGARGSKTTETGGRLRLMGPEVGDTPFWATDRRPPHNKFMQGAPS